MGEIGEANFSDYKGYPHYSFVQPFEANFDHEFFQDWMKKKWHYSFYIAAAYLVVIFSLQVYMKNRGPLRIRKLVLVWDIFLAVQSVFTVFRGFPETFYVLRYYGWEVSVCNSNFNPVSLFWGYFFIFLKAPELLDTLFVVLKKQKLTALHVIHHVLTLVGTWYHFSRQPALGRWVVNMNSGVHAFMYTYFALKAIKVQIPESVSVAITTAQISQMILGLVASSYSLWVIIAGRPCSTNLSVALTGIGIYTGFLYLFVGFFFRRYTHLISKRKKV